MERLADEAREPEEPKAPELKYWQKAAAEREAAAEVEEFHCSCLNSAS